MDISNKGSHDDRNRNPKYSQFSLVDSAPYVGIINVHQKLRVHLSFLQLFLLSRRLLFSKSMHGSKKSISRQKKKGLISIIYETHQKMCQKREKAAWCFVTDS